MNLSKQNLTRQAIVAALYAVLTWAIPALSYGPIQFRLSEVMTLLAFFNPQYVVGLTVGCALSNIISSLGMIDIVVGTFATFCAVTAMSKIKNIWIASLMPAFSAFIIAAEIVIVTKEPAAYFAIAGQIFLSELIIVTGLGVVLFKMMMKNQRFNDLVMGRDIQSLGTVK